VLPYTREHNVGVLAYSPLGSGLLTGQLTPDSTFDSDELAIPVQRVPGETLRRNLAVVDRLAELAGSHGLSIGQLATAWVLAQPGVHVAIVGAAAPATSRTASPRRRRSHRGRPHRDREDRGRRRINHRRVAGGCGLSYGSAESRVLAAT